MTSVRAVRATAVVVALLGALALSPVPVRAAPGTATPIMGRHVLVGDQLASWYASTGRSPKLQGVSISELARLFVEEGAREGVRGDVAFAQAIFETDYFNFSERVPPSTNNFAGIGAPNNVARFPSARLGVRAQIQHLRAYADPAVAATGTAQELVDPRFDLVNPKGQAPTFESLSGRWSPGSEYGQKVVAIFGRILDHAGPSLRGQSLGAPIVSLAEGIGGGVWLLDRAGGVFTLGAARFHGSVPGRRAAGERVGNAAGVDLVASPSRLGYWVLDEAGGVHTFGDAGFFGSIPGRRDAGQAIARVPAAAVERTASGAGYWVLDEAGGVHAFGEAGFFGSIPARRAAGASIGLVRAVDLVVTPTGSGYWVLDEVGGVHTFGDAGFFGSIPGRRAAGHPIGRARAVAMERTADGLGYWVLDSAGGIHTFGRSAFLGTLADDVVGAAFVHLSRTATGYRIATSDGGVFTYGPEFRMASDPG